MTHDHHPTPGAYQRVHYVPAHRRPARSADAGAGQPVGQRCPLCGAPPLLVLAGGHQALCGTDDCPMLSWDPGATLAEINAQAVTVRLNPGPGSAE